MRAKRLIILMIVATFMMTPTVASAQLFEEMTFGPKVGLHWPIGDYGDIADLGFTIGGQLRWTIGPKWNWGINFAYATASGDETQRLPAFETVESDYDATIFELYPFIDYFLARGQEFRDAEMSFFLRGGLGLNFWEIDGDVIQNGVRTASFTEDGMDMMIALGIGVNFFRNFEAVALYNRVLTGDFQDDFGGEYFTVTIGYNFGIQTR